MVFYLISVAFGFWSYHFTLLNNLMVHNFLSIIGQSVSGQWCVCACVRGQRLRADWPSNRASMLSLLASSVSWLELDDLQLFPIGGKSHCHHPACLHWDSTSMLSVPSSSSYIPAVFRLIYTSKFLSCPLLLLVIAAEKAMQIWLSVCLCVHVIHET